jgi:hypothetical protein
MFRNENDKTARRSAEAKAKTVARRKLEDTAALESDISSPIPRSERVPTDTVLCRRADQLLLAPPRIVISLSSPVEEQGLKFFINRFVTPKVARPDGSPHALQPSH